EDGIRDKLVTGVQTCALPIFLVEDVDPGEAEVGGVEVVLAAARAAGQALVNRADVTRAVGGGRVVDRDHSALEVDVGRPADDGAVLGREEKAARSGLPVLGNLEVGAGIENGSCRRSPGYVTRSRYLDRRHLLGPIAEDD